MKSVDSSNIPTLKSGLCIAWVVPSRQFLIMQII
jgi:hypothetical protein